MILCNNVRELNLFYDSPRGCMLSSSRAHLAAENVGFGAKYVFETAAVLCQFYNGPIMVLKVKEANNKFNPMRLADKVSNHLPAFKTFLSNWHSSIHHVS